MVLNILHTAQLGRNGHWFGRPYDGDCEMLIFRLSHRGHDFIDSARSESVWQNAQTQIGKTIGGASLQVLMQLLINYGQTKLGLPTT